MVENKILFIRSLIAQARVSLWRILRRGFEQISDFLRVSALAGAVQVWGGVCSPTRPMLAAELTPVQSPLD